MLDMFQAYLSETPSPDEIPLLVGLRDGNAQMVETVLDWSPAGVEGPNDED